MFHAPTTSRPAIGFRAVFVQRNELGRETVQHGTIFPDQASAETEAAPPYIHPLTVSSWVEVVATAFPEPAVLPGYKGPRKRCAEAPGFQPRVGTIVRTFHKIPPRELNSDARPGQPPRVSHFSRGGDLAHYLASEVFPVWAVALGSTFGSLMIANSIAAGIS